jgi:hypothetical protein
MLRLAFVFAPAEQTDRLFVPDDTYYSMAIARSIANGTGPSVDGTELTNGFQPLSVFLSVPLCWTFPDPDRPIQAIQLILSLVDCFSIFLIYLVLGKCGQQLAGSIGAFLWAFSPLAIGHALGGLETSLALCTILLVSLQFLRLHDKPSKPFDYVLLGIGCGLCVLARIDTAFFLLPFGLVLLATLGWRTTIIAVFSALLIVAPWWIYSLVHFHSVIPESGTAVKEILASHQSQYLTASKQFSWTVGTLIGAPYHESIELRQLLFNMRTPTPSALLLLILLGLNATAFALLRKTTDRPRQALYLCLLLYTFATWMFYTFYLPSLWFISRYFVVIHGVFAMNLALLLAHGWINKTKWIRTSCACLLCAYVLAGIARVGAMRFKPELIPSESGLNGAKGYRQAAKYITQQLPEDAVIAAFQSGALNYFKLPNQRVLNLDGVVSSNAHQAFKSHALADYCKKNNVQWITDWPFNLNDFRQRSTLGVYKPILGETVAKAPMQGSDQFLLIRLDYAPNKPTH